MAARVLQAVGACAGMALARAIARDLFDAGETARALAAISAAITVTPIVAPLIGGYMHVWFGWREPVPAAGGRRPGRSPGSSPGTCRRRIASCRRSTRWCEGLAAGARTLLRERRFLGYVLVIAGSSSAFYAFMTAAPLLLIDVQSVSPETVRPRHDARTDRLHRWPRSSRTARSCASGRCC